MLCVFSVQEEFLPRDTTSSSVVSDNDMHKLPASRDERADGGHGSDSLRYTQCARPSAVRVTREPRTFTLLSIFPIVELPETEAASLARRKVDPVSRFFAMSAPAAHRSSVALFHRPSGTGPSPNITSASHTGALAAISPGYLP